MYSLLTWTLLLHELSSWWNGYFAVVRLSLFLHLTLFPPLLLHHHPPPPFKSQSTRVKLFFVIFLLPFPPSERSKCHNKCTQNYTTNCQMQRAEMQNELYQWPQAAFWAVVNILLVNYDLFITQVPFMTSARQLQIHTRTPHSFCCQWNFNADSSVSIHSLPQVPLLWLVWCNNWLSHLLFSLLFVSFNLPKSRMWKMGLQFAWLLGMPDVRWIGMETGHILDLLCMKD